MFDLFSFLASVDVAATTTTVLPRVILQQVSSGPNWSAIVGVLGVVGGVVASAIGARMLRGTETQKWRRERLHESASELLAYVDEVKKSLDRYSFAAITWIESQDRDDLVRMNKLQSEAWQRYSTFRTLAEAVKLVAPETLDGSVDEMSDAAVNAIDNINLVSLKKSTDIYVDSPDSVLALHEAQDNFRDRLRDLLS